MKKEIPQNSKEKRGSERGNATVITLLIMMLLMGFVTLALTRSANETIAVSNEIAETRTLFAAQASVETMALKADSTFENKLTLETADITGIQNAIPAGYTDYDFTQTVEKTKDAEIIDATGLQFQGLKALRDEWQVKTTATEKNSDVKVTLRRRFFDNRIPIFQFGIFYDDDLEFYPGPVFNFGGRVHANGNLFLMAASGLYFNSKVSAKGEVITDTARNGKPYSGWGDNVWIKNGSAVNKQLLNNKGSAIKTVNGANIFSSNADMPVLYKNANWVADSGIFSGNLLARQKALNLPLKIAKNTANQVDYIELIKRGKNVGDLYNNGTTVTAVTSAATSQDPTVTSRERYANKKGIRVSLSDSKAKLPGCASGSGTSPVTTACGIRLDGSASGDGSDPAVGEARGYQPLQVGSYKATRLNGDRFYRSDREVWIKIELVNPNPVTGTIQTKDVTADILSLGVTHAAPVITSGATTQFQMQGSYVAQGTDSRSVINLQRFIIRGEPLTAADTTSMTSFSAWNGNVVIAGKHTSDPASILDNAFTDKAEHKYDAIVNDSAKPRKIVPFPIEMFDTREGLYNDGLDTATAYGTNVPLAGVMSMVDINVGNMKELLNGGFNTKTPGSGTPFSDAKGGRLESADIPVQNGWVLYISDRRGDGDFDGEYDMEDVYGNNDGTKQPGEDLNNNNTLETDYTNEAVRYTGAGNHVSPTVAATLDHSYYRRGVRLVNAETLPGTYDKDNFLNTKGFTVATENGIYVQGNYNATGVSVSAPTPSDKFTPQDDKFVPASIIADAVTILSGNWNDAKSFRHPFSLSNRQSTVTTIRFAMIAGDTKSSFEATPNQGGGDPRMNGGVHNFKRFLENWGTALNYSGSIINLYNSRNSNGSFKCCSKVYDPPERNWIFDASFLDPTRLPPGTPFLQNITLTGFERVND